GGGPARGAVLLLALLALVGSVVWSTRVPTYSAEKPQHLGLFYVLDAQNGAARVGRWATTAGSTDGIPPAVAEAGGFTGDGLSVPGVRGRDAAGPAPQLDLPAPSVVVVTDAVTGTERLLTLRLVSEREAHMTTLNVPRSLGLSSVDLPGTGNSIDYPAPP